jgi:hypothetical protein
VPISALAAFLKMARFCAGQGCEHHANIVQNTKTTIFVRQPGEKSWCSAVGENKIRQRRPRELFRLANFFSDVKRNAAGGPIKQAVVCLLWAIAGPADL